MKLWILKPVQGLVEPTPWGFGLDVARGFVVRADTEQDARNLAHQNSGSETSLKIKPWLSSRFTECRELDADGAPEIVLMSYTDG